MSWDNENGVKMVTQIIDRPNVPVGGYNLYAIPPSLKTGLAIFQLSVETEGTAIGQFVQFEVQVSKNNVPFYTTDGIGIITTAGGFASCNITVMIPESGCYFRLTTSAPIGGGTRADLRVNCTVLQLS